MAVFIIKVPDQAENQDGDKFDITEQEIRDILVGRRNTPFADWDEIEVMRIH